MKIADDGEILVRGENVTTGYFGAAEATAEAFEGGWFHTGDIGEVDAQGRLFIKGRKKEMIVTPEGLNVFPEDVERVVGGAAGRARCRRRRRQSRRRRTRARGRRRPSRASTRRRWSAQANLALLDHQKIRGISVWPGEELPRTEGTRKLKRQQVREWVASGSTRRRRRRAHGSGVEALVAQFAGGRAVAGGTTLDELGLSSLERVELMVALEERFGRTIDESAFARATDVAALEQLVRAEPARGARTSTLGRRAGGLPVVEPGLVGARRAARQPADVDPAAGARLRVGEGRRARAPRRGSRGR